MFADMVGFSRQMGVDEARRLRLLDVHNRIIQQTGAEQHGAISKTIGAACLVDFPSVVHAVQSAQANSAQFCVPIGSPLPGPASLVGEGPGA